MLLPSLILLHITLQNDYLPHLCLNLLQWLAPWEAILAFLKGFCLVTPLAHPFPSQPIRPIQMTALARLQLVHV